MTSASDFPVLLWFRDDLRLEDHAALHAAVETGRPVLPVFILDDQAAGPWALGGASRWWLHHSLAALQDALNERGSPLCLRRGDSVTIIAEIAKQTGATEVFTGGSADPRARRLDKAVSEAIDGQLHRMRTTTLFHPDAVRTKTGGAYSVYTPFANACRALGDPRPPLPAPKAIRAAKASRSDRLEEWDLLPTKPDWAGGLRDVWTPGEAGAMARAETFLANGLAGYAAARDKPGREGTSMLSPHMHFGEISPSYLWHMAHQQPKSRGREVFIRELLWREFCANQLWHNPGLPDTPLRPEFAAMPWRDDKAGAEGVAEGPDRGADGRCRNAAAMAGRLDAQSRPDDRRELPDQAPDDPVAGRRGLVLGHAGGRRSGEQRRQLAMGRRVWRRRGAVFPHFQSSAAGPEIRYRGRLRAPVRAGDCRTGRPVYPCTLGSAAR